MKQDLNALLKKRVTLALQRMGAVTGNASFQWDDASYTCIPSSLNDHVKTIDTGAEEFWDLKLTVPLEQFEGNPPSSGDYIVYQGVKIQITNIVKPFHGVYWVFECSKPSIH